MITALDLLVLDKVAEPLARFLNKSLGISNYTVARWILTISLALGFMAGYSFLLEWIPATEAERKATFALPPTSFILLLMLDAMIVWRGFKLASKLERSYHETGLGGALPPNLRDGWIGPASERKSLLLLIPILISLPIFLHLNSRADASAATFWLACIITGLVGHYFLACTPLPPKRRAREVSKAAFAQARI